MLGKATVCAIAIAGLQGCSDNAPLGPASPTDPMRARLVAMGFRPDMIVDEGDHYVVEGDIVFDKAGLGSAKTSQIGNYTLRPSAQYSTYQLVTVANVKIITANLSGIAAYPAWQTAARAAFNDWNHACGDCAVHITETTGAADITYLTYSKPADSLTVPARSQFPDSAIAVGKPGKNVFINTAYTFPLTPSWRELIMVHELGHTLGLRHSNWAPRGEAENPLGAVLIPGTPTSDPYSIMNSDGSGAFWNGFSTYDTLAVLTRYHVNTVNMTGPMYITTAGTYTYSATPSPAGNYYYTWRVKWCNNGSAPNDCNGSSTTLAAGMNLTSKSVGFPAVNRYQDITVVIQRSATGVVLATKTLHVLGPDYEGCGGGTSC